MILEDDQVHGVGEIRFLGLRQLDPENLLGDRRLVLENRPFRLRRIRRLDVDGRLLRCGADPEGGDEREYECVARHYWFPFGAAAFGTVTITDRFSFVRYLPATRCTSAAVTFRT